ncbi:lamin tail domain-containing protein, partial [Candidatus Bipolaricaulota bacterium]
KPVIACAADVNATSDLDRCGTDVTVLPPEATDNCGDVTVTNSRTGTSDASGFYPVGTTTIEWTAKDACGNTAQCYQAITVEIGYNAAFTLSKAVEYDSEPVTPGDVLQYTITLFNDGDVPVHGVAVVDSLAPTVVGPGLTDAGSDGILSVGETWEYTATYVVAVDDVNAGIVNTATVTALDLCEHEVVREASAAVPWENHPPTSEDLIVHTCRNEPVSFDVVAFDQDIFVDPEKPGEPQIHPLVFEILNPTDNGSTQWAPQIVEYGLDHTATTGVVYQPNPAFVGEDFVSFVARDPYDEYTIISVQIVVEVCNEPIAGGGGELPRIGISEIAWGGTAANPSDEWIELVNLSPTPVDLAGWTLRWRRKQPTTEEERRWKIVELEGTVEANGFFLMERTHDDVVADILAGQLYDTTPPYHLDFSDQGDVVYLEDAAGEVVDSANADRPGEDGWPAGQGEYGSPPFASMERVDVYQPDFCENWSTNCGVIVQGHDADEILLIATASATNEERACAQHGMEEVYVVPQGEVLLIEVTADLQPSDRTDFPRLVMVPREEETWCASARHFSSEETKPGVYVFTIDTTDIQIGEYEAWVQMGRTLHVHVGVTVSEP